MRSALPGWALRLTDLLGARPEEIGEVHLARLVRSGVREDADLDFKRERYGNGETERRELAADIAAMANERGGVIAIGISDEDDVAAELTPVKLIDGEEGRIRQIAAGNISPHVNFDVRVVAHEDDPSMGYYIVSVPPSTLRPHAVLQGRNLRYPRRDGTTTRWLSEPEIAAAYRDRFRTARDQIERVTQVLAEGHEAMDLSGGTFLLVVLVPTDLGSMAIDLARVSAIENWARGLGEPHFFDGFFDSLAPPTGGVRAHRVTLTTPFDSGQLASWHYAELYDDGSGFGGRRLPDPRGGTAVDHAGQWVLNEDLLWDLGRCLHLLGRHAAENCGAWGDAVVVARVVGQDMRLAYPGRVGPFASPAEIEGARTLQEGISRHTVVLDGLGSVGPDFSAATRLIATDLFHAFGSPEVRQIAADGTLRAQYLGGNGELRAWAERRGLTVSDETVAGG